MASFNQVILVGNLTRDPELRYLPSETAVAEFGLAINRRFTVNGEQREEVCFVDCAAFGKSGETINQYCHKGSSLLVSGRLKYDSWEATDGGKRSKLSVVVDSFQFLGSREGNGGGEQQEDRRQRQAASRGTSQRRVPQADIPF